MDTLKHGFGQIKAKLKQIKPSEFQLIRPADTYRKETLFASLAKAGHPISKFCWGKQQTHTHTHTPYCSDVCVSRAHLSGNAQTLKLEPRQKQINTYERLRLLWRRFYSAHYMTLAIQSTGSHTPPVLLAAPPARLLICRAV